MTFLLGTVLAQAALVPLPRLNYAFTSFATAAPDQAALFCNTYLARQSSCRRSLLRTSTSPSRVDCVRFPYSGTFHDVYFVNDPSKRSGQLTPTAFANQLHGVHRFDEQETWDWFMDWHLCLSAPNVDLVLARLLRDGKNIVTRSSYSFYVEVPFD